MTRESIVEHIREHERELRRQFDVSSLSLFGSAARDDLREDSDIDVLVRFDGPPTFRTFFALKDYLESIIGRPVDLVTEEALREELRPAIEDHLVRVA